MKNYTDFANPKLVLCILHKDLVTHYNTVDNPCTPVPCPTQALKYQVIDLITTLLFVWKQRVEVKNMLTN